MLTVEAEGSGVRVACIVRVCSLIAAALWLSVPLFSCSCCVVQDCCYLCCYLLGLNVRHPLGAAERRRSEMESLVDYWYQPSSERSDLRPCLPCETLMCCSEHNRQGPGRLAAVSRSGPWPPTASGAPT